MLITAGGENTEFGGCPARRGLVYSRRSETKKEESMAWNISKASAYGEGCRAKAVFDNSESEKGVAGRRPNGVVL